MDVITLQTEGLGDRSYIVAQDGTAVVIDPQRDIDRLLVLLDERRLDVALVCETHIHNDYVTGGLALARITGAEYAVAAADEVRFDRRPIEDDAVIDLGALTVRALHTPGHTPTHLSYLVTDGGDPAVFTGGSMLYGTVGRTDLIGPDMTERLTRDQHRSVRRLAEQLGPGTHVYPTHGFGSFCSSAGGGERTEGTIADERAENLACTIDDTDEFVRRLLSGLTAHPPYYRHMAPLNLSGPLAPDLSPPAAVGPDELARRVARGDWVIDLRSREEFPERHLAGTINADPDDSLATYVGWAIPWGTPISLIAPEVEQVAHAQRELVRIGLDRPLGMAVGPVEEVAAGQTIVGYRRARFADLVDHPDAVVVDVRRADEWDAGHVDGAVHLPMEEIVARAGGLPDAELWVHCASGVRSAIAASLIARAGKTAVYVDDDDTNMADSGRPVVTGG